MKIRDLSKLFLKNIFLSFFIIFYLRPVIASSNLLECENHFDSKSLFHQAISSLINENFQSLLQIPKNTGLNLKEKLLILKLIHKFNSELFYNNLELFELDESSLVYFLNPLLVNKNLSQDQQKKLWILAEKSQYQLSFTIAKFILKNIDLNINNPQYDLTDAYITSLIDSILKLKLKDAEKSDLAILLIEKNTIQTLNLLDRFEIKDKDSFLKILLKIAEKNPSSLFQKFQYKLMDFNEEQRKELALKCIPFLVESYLTFNWENFFKTFQISDRKWSIDFLQSLTVEKINNKGWEFSFPAFFKLNSNERFKIALFIVQKVKLSRLKQTEKRNAKLIEIIGKPWDFFQDTNEFRLAFFQRLPLEAIELESSTQLEKTLLLNDENEKSLKTVLLEFSKNHPDLLPLTFINSLYDNVQNSLVSYRLLKEYFAFIRYQENKRDFPTSSLETLSLVLGYDFFNLKKNNAKPSLEFYELSLDIQSKLSKPAFQKIAIAPELYKNDSQLILLLEWLRNFFLISNKKNNDETWTEKWERIVTSLDLIENGIHPSHINKSIAQIQEKVILQIYEQIKELKIPFHSTQFESLKEKWGNLDPIWTLISRMHDSLVWEKEAPILIQVFKCFLDNSFKKYKFGFPPEELPTHLTPYNSISANDQISMLNDSQKKEWQRDRLLLKVVPNLPEKAIQNEAEEKEEEKNTLILTVLNSDPKFMLTQGNLVPRPSFDNYKTGRLFQTLLAYAIDANVQTVASFRLGPENFHSLSDYLHLVKELKNPITNLKLEFNGNRRILKALLSNQTEVSSKELEFASLQQMLKMGMNIKENRPGLKFESEYFENNPYLKIMREQHLELFQLLSHDLGAYNMGPVLIKKSRNPAGIYSDTLRGMQNDEYILP